MKAIENFVRTEIKCSTVDFEDQSRLKRRYRRMTLVVARMQVGHFADNLARAEATERTPFD